MKNKDKKDIKSTHPSAWHRHTIQHVNTLMYYDGVQLFDAQDSSGKYYVAINNTSNDLITQHDEYIVIEVVLEDLEKFREGLIDSGTLLDSRPSSVWFLARFVNDLAAPIVIEAQTSPLPAFPRGVIL
jgi:hypothetical protein